MQGKHTVIFVITSPYSDSGVTTTSLGLAYAADSLFFKTLVLDTNPAEISEALVTVSGDIDVGFTDGNDIDGLLTVFDDYDVVIIDACLEFMHKIASHAIADMYVIPLVPTDFILTDLQKMVKSLDAPFCIIGNMFTPHVRDNEKFVAEILPYYELAGILPKSIGLSQHNFEPFLDVYKSVITHLLSEIKNKHPH